MLKITKLFCRTLILGCFLYICPASVFADYKIEKVFVNALPTPYKPPEFNGIDTWINSSPLSIARLTGKVVLVEFWHYTCMNCINTLPYLNDWYGKYKNDGFEIIGIHTPEFAFEQSPENVRRAVSQNGITYPVALDNRMLTWHRYQNQFWPTLYLINKDGYVVYIKVGEGDYVTTENNIRMLLGLDPNLPRVDQAPPLPDLTPEIQVGYASAKEYASLEDMQKNETYIYTEPQRLTLNQWALNGSWKVTENHATSMATDAFLKLHFKASKVSAVMGSPGKAVQVQVKVRLADGKMVQRQVYVTNIKLYTLYEGDEPVDGMLYLQPDTAGLEIYSLNFAS